MENSLTHKHGVRNMAMAVLGVSAGLLGATHVANADTVTAQAGDSLWKISQDKGVSVDQLKQMNNLQSDSIMVGQKLSVNVPADSNNNDGAVKTVTVKQGDTLSEIAQDNNTDVNTIKQLNGLSSDLILVGQQLKVSGNVTAINNTNTGASQSASTAQASTVNQSTAGASASTNTGSSNYSGGSYAVDGSSAANAIAQAESGGSYTARNGRYYGKYQLDESYLGGDLSPANQERVFQQYCNQRYGSVAAAASFRASHGWY